MKVIALLAATLLFLGLSVLLVAWPDLQELRRAKNWNVIHSDQTTAELHGVTISIDQARAMILPGLPDRAVIYLRLGVQGDKDLLIQWLACDIGLTDGAGHKWLPLLNQAGLQVVKALGDTHSDMGQSCSQSLFMAEGDDVPSYSEQAFLVPVDVLDHLRLELSSMATRPDARSMPFKPVLRPAT